MGCILVPGGPKGFTWGMGVLWDPMRTYGIPWGSCGVPGGPVGALWGLTRSQGVL